MTNRYPGRPSRDARGATSVEVYGFVAWTSSAVAYGEQRRAEMHEDCSNIVVHLAVCVAVLFLLWAFVPASILERIGITYYPSKYWATALPVWCCAAVVFALVVYER